MERIEAAIAVCKCPSNHQIYGVRFEKIMGHWKYTWAFEMKKTSEYGKGYNAEMIKGDISPKEDYPGCPYCGSMAFVVCGCGKLSCQPSHMGEFTCEWCGNTGILTEYDGSGFNSSEDR